METIALTQREVFMTKATEIERLRVEATQLLLEAEALNRRWLVIEAAEKIVEAKNILWRIEQIIARDIRTGEAARMSKKAKAASVGVWI